MSPAMRLAIRLLQRTEDHYLNWCGLKHSAETLAVCNIMNTTLLLTEIKVQHNQVWDLRQTTLPRQKLGMEHGYLEAWDWQITTSYLRLSSWASEVCYNTIAIYYREITNMENFGVRKLYNSSTPSETDHPSYHPLISPAPMTEPSCRGSFANAPSLCHGPPAAVSWALSTRLSTLATPFCMGEGQHHQNQP